METAFFLQIFFVPSPLVFMRKCILLISFLTLMFTHVGIAMTNGGEKKTKGDSLQPPRRSLFKPKREESSPVIEKMSDTQLMLLIDHMFEATYMPPDLWSQVMLETARRNLSKLTRKELETDDHCSQAGELHIEKIRPDYVAPASDPNMMFLYPAAAYYNNEWDEDITNLFKDQFAFDTTYTLELENAEFGCFKMPSWGPMSSPFGWRNNRYHKGIDIQLRKGDTVSCAFDGMVRFAQKKGAYGNVVIVRHYNGLETVYGHLFKISVAEGQVVGAGDLIGLAGNTGRSTGPHLHFEVRFMGVPVDPQYFISFDYGSLMYNTVLFKKNKSGLLSAFHPDTEYHTVEKGETFAEIANQYCTTTVKLRKLNNMAPKQYVRLKAGQVLRVRDLDHSESAAK